MVTWHAKVFKALFLPVDQDRSASLEPVLRISVMRSLACFSSKGISLYGGWAKEVTHTLFTAREEDQVFYYRF